jgi:hypothetical protein
MWAIRTDLRPDSRPALGPADADRAWYTSAPYGTPDLSF